MSVLKLLALAALHVAPGAAFWRLPCSSPVVVERADPIVNPGAVSGHLHTIMGGNAFDFTMDYEKTQTSDCTSCQVKGDLSNYWIPSLYYKHQNGTFEQVKQTGGLLAYYLQRRGNDAEQLHAFPKGFRMVAGDPYKRSGGNDFASQAISYHCLDYSGKTTSEETGNFPNYNCPSGLRAQVFFPACWDGKNLDSDDHKSHVAYPVTAYNNGKCPDSHPVHLISLFYEVIWDTNPFAHMWYGDSQPFVWSMGDSTGYGLHGDFLNGWDVDLLQRAVDNCNNLSGRVEDCQEFNLYTAQEAGQCKKQSTLTESLNYLPALPGCNPVTNGPTPAVKAANCANNPSIPGDNDNDNDSNSSSTSKAAVEPSRTAKNVSPTTLVTSSKAEPKSTKPINTKYQYHSSAEQIPSVSPGSFYPSATSPTSTIVSATASFQTSKPPVCRRVTSTITVQQTSVVTVTAVPSRPVKYNQKARHVDVHLRRSGRTGPAYH